MEQSGGRIGAESGEPAIPHCAPQRRSRLSPAFLAFYLLARNGERPSSIGVDLSQPGRGLLRCPDREDRAGFSVIIRGKSRTVIRMGSP